MGFGIKDNVKDEENLRTPDDLIGLKALVVDDNNVSLEILKTILEAFSFKVDTANSGLEAIEKLKISSKYKPYELVLMDWRMPIMDGIETARKIKTDPDLIKIPQILMVTAYGREEVMQRAKDAGLDGFLMKPVNSSVLYNTVLTIFGHQSNGEKQVFQREFKASKDYKMVQGARILLVEDNEINQEFAVELLETNGFLVEIAENGEKAVQMVSQTLFDAVLMDLQMPVMDGYEATKEIRKQEKGRERLPIIAMTADALSGVKESVIQAGMDDYVTKPIDHEKLFSALIKWIKPGERKKYIQTKSGELIKDEGFFPALNGIDTATGIARIGGDHESYKKLLKKFHKNHLDIIIKIKKALDENDIDFTKYLVHTLKGVAGNIGANKLYACANDFEKAIKQQKKSVYDRKLENLKKSLDEVFMDIESLAKNKSETNFDSDSIASRKKPDISKAVLIIDELKDLIQNDDTEASRCLSVLKRELTGSQFQTELVQMENLIENYDFDKSLELLAKISQVLYK